MSGLLKNLFGKGQSSDERELGLLEHVPVFEGFSRGEIVELEKVMHRREHNSGDVLAYKGSAGHGMYVILSGSVAVMGEEGRQLAELGPGEIFGELSLLDDSPRSATVVAKADCVTLGLFRHDMQKLIHAAPSLGAALAMKLAAIVAVRLRKANDRIEELEKELMMVDKRCGEA